MYPALSVKVNCCLCNRQVLCAGARTKLALDNRNRPSDICRTQKNMSEFRCPIREVDVAKRHVGALGVR